VGLAELLAALEGDAREEIERLDAETRREVEQVLEQAEQRAADEERERLRSEERKLAAEATTVLSRARRDAGRILRDAREALFLEALDDLRARLARVREQPDYHDLLRQLIVEALAALPANVLLELRIDARDEALAMQIVRELGRMNVEVSAGLETWGGIELATDDGRLVRNTIEERLANAETALRLRLATALDGTEA
jgi:vacuolar-type H+-ATPase subunit E/Vma4